MTDRRTILGALAVSLILAALGALASTFEAGTGSIRWGLWAFRTLTAVVASACLLETHGRSPRFGTPRWCHVAAALSLAVLVPVAVQSTLHDLRADGAFLAVVLAAGLTYSSAGPVSILVAGLLTVMA